MACNECEHQMSTFFPAYWEKEDKLVELLIQHGVLRRTIRCEKCGNEALIRHWSKGYYFYCGHRENKKVCRYKKSARVNTFVGDTAMSIQKVLFFCLYWLVHPQPRHHVLVEELQCGNTTVVDWSTFNREVCVNWMLHNRKQIGGWNKIVELEESKPGQGKSNKRQSAEGQLMIGGVERGDNSQFFLVPVKQRNQETLWQIITDWILPGTIIISDCWKTYDIETNEDFIRLQDNHSLEFVSTGKSGYIHMEKLMKMGRLKIKEHMDSTEMKLQSVSYSIPCFRQKREHFEGYLAEYIFKHVHSRKTRMHHFLIAAAALYPPPP